MVVLEEQIGGRPRDAVRQCFSAAQGRDADSLAGHFWGFVVVRWSPGLGWQVQQ